MEEKEGVARITWKENGREGSSWEGKKGMGMEGNEKGYGMGKKDRVA